MAIIQCVVCNTDFSPLHSCQIICSRECRLETDRLRKIAARAAHGQCLQCGNKFAPRQPGGQQQKYCSLKCRQKANDDRRGKRRLLGTALPDDHVIVKTQAMDSDEDFCMAMMDAGYKMAAPVKTTSPSIAKPFAIFAPHEVRQQAGFINPKDE